MIPFMNSVSPISCCFRCCFLLFNFSSLCLSHSLKFTEVPPWQFLVLGLVTFILSQISTRERVLIDRGIEEDECVPPNRSKQGVYSLNC